ncbi:MAG TPA: MG2 domain-containing protein, partial [Blastocatellia bacterium]|nr:MG2 domain-containing protein [Blastocatellia bacterium]
MKSLTAAGLLFLIAVYSIQAGQPGYQDLKRQAEAYYSEASYSKAHELYEQAAAFPLAPDDSRWVAFRLGDTEWRAEASTNNSDQSKSDDARSRLESVISAFKRPEDRDLTWAQAQESLGDFWWTRPNLQNWNQAWPAYQQVLDWWASSKDIDNARNRYLGIIWKISEPRQDYPYYYYGYSYAPLDTIENAVKIALSGKDKAHAHFLLALRLRNEGGIPERRRVPAEFEAALVPGKATKSYDKALYFYGEWLASQGPMVQDSNHQWQQQPDYAKALDMFRKLVASYSKGESKFWDQANEQIKSITTSSVGLGVGNVYLPGSEIQFGLSWRNVRNINLALYRVDLTQDINFGQNDAVTGAWIQRIATAGKEKIKSWSKETTDKGDYKPGYENITMDQKLPTGAYLLEATTPTFASARDVILVSDAGIITKTSKSHAVVYVCNALDGSPLAGADVKIWWVNYKNGTHTIHDLNGRTNQDGIANFAITSDSGYTPELFATAKTADRQAFSSSYSRYYNPNAQSWRIYAYTDRPAYRPGETVQWKFVARKYDGEIYSTPANQTLKLRIVDPHQSVVKEAQATMNQFGSAWGSLDLGESLPLGEYRIVFEDAQSQSIIGNATLFRLEEYKLPEFKVAVQTPEENGRKKTFRVGDKVDVNIQADYYFGGPVANASVEVLVYQNPFYKYWTRPHEYSWYYEEPGYQQNYGARNGQVIKHETLTTDATGKAVLIFDTPQGNQGDFQYTIEARVTDASRREVIAEDSVKVTNQSYYVYPEAKHYIYHPQDSVGVDIKAVDANDKGVQVEGKLSVTRDYWYEIWLDPSGREVKDDELKQLRARSKTFPPAPARPDQKPWQLKFNGYLHEDISS